MQTADGSGLGTIIALKISYLITSKITIGLAALPRRNTKQPVVMMWFICLLLFWDKIFCNQGNCLQVIEGQVVESTNGEIERRYPIVCINIHALSAS